MRVVKINLRKVNGAFQIAPPSPPSAYPKFSRFPHSRYSSAFRGTSSFTPATSFMGNSSFKPATSFMSGNSMRNPAPISPFSPMLSSSKSTSTLGGVSITDSYSGKNYFKTLRRVARDIYGAKKVKFTFN